MGKNFVAPGDQIQIAIPAGGCESGGKWNSTTGVHVEGVPILVGADLVGIPENSYDAGTSGEVTLNIEGIYSNIAKKATDTFAIGDKLYLDTANSELTTTSSGNVWAGHAMSVGANGDTTCTIRLKG